MSAMSSVSGDLEVGMDGSNVKDKTAYSTHLQALLISVFGVQCVEFKVSERRRPFSVL